MQRESELPARLMAGILVRQLAVPSEGHLIYCYGMQNVIEQ